MGADIDLKMARREAERAMRDIVAITRESGTQLDETSGEYVPAVIQIYSGKSRLKHPRSYAKPVVAGSQLLVETSLELQVPVDTGNFRPGDVVEMIACPDRPNQVGRRFQIIGPFDGSQTTALRYRVEVFDER